MSIPIYHQAARDGFLELLKETTKRDTNAKDEDGMTPTLWAAFEGNVEALRLLVGRGGDPDKYDNYGNTALHLAAARGNIQVVTFLVNFGVNLYALDIDTHTPQELAAINNADNVLRYLDAVVAKMEMEDPRKAGKLKEKALKESEKLKKNFKKIQQKADELILKEEQALEQSIKRMQMEGDNSSEASDDDVNIPFNNNSRKKFSEMVSNNSVKSSISSSIGSSIFGRTISKKSAIGTVLRKINIKKEALEQEKTNEALAESKTKESSSNSLSDDKTNLLSNRHFKIRDTQENGNMSVRKLKGLKRDSEILFVAPPPPPNDPPLTDITSSVSKSHQNMMDNHKSTSSHNDNLGMFERPGFGSVSFRDSIQTASLFSYDHLSDDIEASCEANDSALKLEHKLDATSVNEESCGDDMNESIDDSNSSHISSTTSSRSHSEFGNSSHPGSSIGSAGSLVLRNRISIRNARTNTKLDQRDENNYAAVNIFLTTLGLRDLIPIFRSEKIDAHVLQYLEDDDLKDMSVPVGSRKRIMRAIAERRHDLEYDRPIEDSRL